jgi:hypothetical protein
MITASPRGPQSASPLACVAGAIPASERTAHFELATRLFTTAVLQKRVLSDGYAYRFDADDFEDLAHWVDNERRCCPFVRFVLELDSGERTLWMYLTGPGDMRTFLDAALPTVPAAIRE